MYDNFSGVSRVFGQKSLLAKNFIELVTIKFCFSLVTLQKLVVPNLLQCLECAANKLCVYKVVEYSTWKENTLNKCLKQDFISIALLVMVPLVLK